MSIPQPGCFGCPELFAMTSRFGLFCELCGRHQRQTEAQTGRTASNQQGAPTTFGGAGALEELTPGVDLAFREDAFGLGEGDRREYAHGFVHRSA